jgi:hypothetical protein
MRLPRGVPYFAALGLVLAACADGDTTTIVNDDGDVEAGENEPGDDLAEEPLGPVYALHVIAFDPDFNATSYVLLSDTLDLGGVSLSNAREFPGWATIAAVNGEILVASEGDPRVTRYRVGRDLAWQQGETVSFANLGLTDAGFGRQWFLDGQSAYAELELTQRIVWDPDALVIQGVKEASQLTLKRDDGFELEPGLNRQPRIRRGPVLRPFYYAEKTDWLEYSPNSQIAVYDPQTHEESAIIDAPCPGLHVESQDELGNTYFSLWDALPKLALYGQGPAPCVARIKPDNTLDEDWRPNLREWTGGRHVLVFRYVRDGKALGNVLHAEELGATFTGPYDPAVGDELDAGEHYRVWLFDLQAEAAIPVSGMEATAWGFHASDIDGRSFVFLPHDDYGRTTVYEVDVATATAQERFEMTGWVYDWVRVR